LGISKESLCKLILFEHSTMIYTNLLATLRAFRHDNFLKQPAGSDPPTLSASAS
jgi:hypothetical protein